MEFKYHPGVRIALNFSDPSLRYASSTRGAKRLRIGVTVSLQMKKHPKNATIEMHSRVHFRDLHKKSSVHQRPSVDADTFWRVLYIFIALVLLPCFLWNDYPLSCIVCFCLFFFSFQIGPGSTSSTGTHNAADIGDSTEGDSRKELTSYFSFPYEGVLCLWPTCTEQCCEFASSSLTVD